MSKRFLTTVGVLKLLALVLAADAAAQSASRAEGPTYPIDVEAAPRPVGRAFPASDPIKVDGRLDEPAWSE
ncbi:MAG: hypothetical protein HY704_11290, partial [Gemmatimonadetes bacterium]|nr:hypothetical protein [Gemmatimonadota bacterium]